ncbi:unnamed protein product [Staurois parvus]|uniref:Uncharacterized protein n=1 Tax=Staurois parvus TaxID=386267 RepID=A0ABN9DZE8_9NEOB|nr:unnamed protein product [Staurois parvus]
MGPLCPCPNSKKPMKKVPGASLILGPRAVPEFPNGQSAAELYCLPLFCTALHNCWHNINPVL